MCISSHLHVLAHSFAGHDVHITEANTEQHEPPRRGRAGNDARVARGRRVATERSTSSRGQLPRGLNSDQEDNIEEGALRGHVVPNGSDDTKLLRSCVAL